ncbi:MAG TPA: VirB3 family type IV secretion system protein [Steroidobacteraceae bacterium]|jgi:type IV secretion system protein VirB3
MDTQNRGPATDPLFVGATRPPMRWGVTYAALLFNLVFTMEAFLLTKNLLTLLLCLPVHGVCVLLCARDARFFDLLLLWGRTRLPAALGTLRLWRASSYSPLSLDMPDGRGIRRAAAAAHGRREKPAC